jgi:hypothetical protein
LEQVVDVHTSVAVDVGTVRSTPTEAGEERQKVIYAVQAE